MMEKPAIYVETSVVSYLVARPSRDLVVAAHQQLTLEWWRNQRQEYDLFVSQIVIDEARAGDPEMAAKRMAALEDLSLLEINEAVTHLADALVKSRAILRRRLQTHYTSVRRVWAAWTICLHGTVSILRMPRCETRSRERAGALATLRPSSVPPKNWRIEHVERSDC